MNKQVKSFKQIVFVSVEIRYSGASSHYCCYGNHAAGSTPI